MAVAYSAGLRHARLDQITSQLGSGALLRVYSGTRPSAGGAATTLLAELACSSPFAPAASGNQLTASAISDATAPASGTATWFRLVTSGGQFVVDGDVRETADPNNGEALVLDSKSIVQGGTVSVSSLAVTGGNVG
jgi:hypothetical protein